MNRVGVKSLLSQVYLCLFLCSGSALGDANKGDAPRGDAARNFIEEFRLKQGDLIFTDLNCELCEAIEAVTIEQFGEGPALSHAGILDLTNPKAPQVIEALPKVGVVSTPLLSFLSRSPGGFQKPNGFYLGRFKEQYRDTARRAVIVSRGFIGLPYDEFFRWDDSTSYYCTKMLSRVFIFPDYPQWIRTWPHPFEDLALMFQPTPMFFGKADSSSRRLWEKYFKSLGRPVPDGDLGISPLGMYLQGRAKFFE